MNSDSPEHIGILVIGSLPPPVGGTSVSLQHLVAALGRDERVDLAVVNTNTIRGSKIGGLVQFCLTLARIFKGTRKADIVTLHVSLVALPVIGPAVLVISRLLGKPFLVRRFGGNDHRELNGWRFWITDYLVRKADTYLIQTRSLFEALHDYKTVRIGWFPTSRPAVISLAAREQDKCRKFVFISHIRPTKGIHEIITAAKKLGNKVEIGVYGPFYDGLSEAVFSGLDNVRYRGVLEPDKVPTVLAQYDALLLPTYYLGEGYPGIILEAFSAGIPVIASSWKAIPELVDETCGILVPPQDSQALYEAMNRMVQEDGLYVHLRQGALNRHKEYDLDKWADRFVQYCLDDVNARRSHADH